MSQHGQSAHRSEICSSCREHGGPKGRHENITRGNSLQFQGDHRINGTQRQPNTVWSTAEGLLCALTEQDAGVCSPHCHRRSRCASGARRQRTGAGPQEHALRRADGGPPRQAIMVLMLVGIVVSRPVRESLRGCRHLVEHRTFFAERRGIREPGRIDAVPRPTLLGGRRAPVRVVCHRGWREALVAGGGGAHGGGRGDGGRGSEVGVRRQGRGAPPAGTRVRGRRSNPWLWNVRFRKGPLQWGCPGWRSGRSCGALHGSAGPGRW